MSTTEMQTAHSKEQELATPASRPICRPDQYRHALEQCLHDVELVLARQGSAAETERTRKVLEEVAAMVGACKAAGTDRAHAGFLTKLASLYAAGWDRRDNPSFSDTASGYAAVIHALSRRYPEFDYGHSLGQLLEFMARLFAARDDHWKVIYKHLRAIPENVRAKRVLNRVCSADIREWFDAGVQNLFSLQSNLTTKIRELAAHEDEIRDEIQKNEKELREVLRSLEPADSGKVVVLRGRVMQRKLRELELEQEEIEQEKAGRENTLRLIESDIREFEGILREACRAYFLRVV